MANQFTKAEAEGLAKPTSVNQFSRPGSRRTKHDEGTKDRIRAELVAKRLHKFAMAKGENIKKHWMDAPQVAAAKVIVDKGKPSLQAVEQTVLGEWDNLSQEELESIAKALILQHPEIIKALNLVPAPQEVVINQANELVPTITEKLIDTGS